MYITLDNQQLELTSMTKGFLINALARYEALCHAGNIHFETHRENKATREAIKEEIKRRQRLRFTPIID